MSGRVRAGSRRIPDGKATLVDLKGKDTRVRLPGAAPDPVASVIRLELTGALEVDNSLPRPAADGVITLPLWMADIHNPGYGGEARLGEDAGVPAIVDWTDSKTHLAWSFELTHPGDYEVIAMLDPQKPGAKLAFQVGKESLTASIVKSEQPVVLGRLTISGGGVQELNVQPVQAGWQPITLRSIALRPVVNSSSNLVK